jgi:hypothetical protein
MKLKAQTWRITWRHFEAIRPRLKLVEQRAQGFLNMSTRMSLAGHLGVREVASR